jgi:hypothetical protein
MSHPGGFPSSGFKDPLEGLYDEEKTSNRLKGVFSTAYQGEHTLLPKNNY